MATEKRKDTRNLQKYPPILFDEARRREFIDPDMLVDLVGLRPGERAVDFGAGAGFFSIPMARAVGKKGAVLAVDINPNNLSIIGSKAKHEKVLNIIELVEGNVETAKGLAIDDESVDLVMLSSVLSQFAGKEKVLNSAERILRPGGRLIIFEWHQREMLLGPPPKARIAKEDVVNMLFAGTRPFRLLRDLDAGFYHYCLIFLKQ